ncbi:ribose/galactose ABC transporter permease [Spiroplasma helicoides]|uniref:Ribose/galactose ABC transporter permease n=1 Tax=Spiroplasma helicoides TaxID=216938 RepID=A0A1B3SKV0_9MOLU|nr:ABC transporter permease [Spiroplasma helicoides]AOG60578.1 ribose/galactose ABC transporter permease [Spiroplasma helicoides]
MFLAENSDFSLQVVSYILGYFVIFFIAAMAGMVSERSGVVNIGIEGFMTIGALIYSICGVYFHPTMGNWSQILGMIFAIIGASVYSLLHILATLKLKCDQIISGTAINILAQGIGLFVVYSGLIGGDTTKIDSTYGQIAADKGTNAFSIYLVITIIITCILGIYFSLTKTGKRHIAAGENPYALEAAGISVIKYRFIWVVISAGLAGLAGTFFVMIRLQGSFRGDVQGYGFLAMAIMIAGQWRIKYIALFTLLFSIFFSLSEVVPLKVPSIPTGKWMSALPFVFSLIAMIVIAKWSKPPAAIGQPYDKAKR